MNRVSNMANKTIDPYTFSNLNNLSSKLKGVNIGIAERLKAHADVEAKPKRIDSAEAAFRAKSKDSYRIPSYSPIKKPVAVAPQAAPTEVEPLKMAGTYGDGLFQMNGVEGSYSQLPGGQFELNWNGFKGIMMADHKGYATKDGQTYSFNVNRDKDTFSLENIAPVPPLTQFPDKPILEGSIDTSKMEINFPGMTIKYNADGSATAMMTGSKGDQILGKGLLDPKGNAIFAFETGQSYHANFRLTEKGGFLVDTLNVI